MSDEDKENYIKAMGQEVGEVFYALWQEIAQLHSKWSEYVVLFGTSEARVNLLNEAAPHFANQIQSTIWNDVTLHVARLTDPPHSGRNKERSNLSLGTLLAMVDRDETKQAATRLLRAAHARAEFCRDWRQRLLAHHDLMLALGRAEPLADASRQKMKDALASLADVLNTVNSGYTGFTTAFHSFDVGIGGAFALLYALDDGVKAEKARRDRLAAGRIEPDDYAARNL